MSECDPIGENASWLTDEATPDPAEETTSRPSRAPLWLRRLGTRADRYFISDEIRTRSATEIANLRMGLVLILTGSLGAILFIPNQFEIWPGRAAWVFAFLSVATFLLPFLLRQTNAVTHLGQILCLSLGLISIGSSWMSAGQATAHLTFLAILPILGLLIGGARSALFWSLFATCLAGTGAVMVSTGTPPSSAYAGSSILDHYSVAMICIVGVSVLAQLFEVFWNRTAMEVADKAQAALEEREAQNQTLLQHASEGVMICDASAVVQFASPAAERLLSIARGESIGRRLRDFVAPGEFERTRPAWEQVLRDPTRVAHLELQTSPDFGRGDPQDARVLDLAVSNEIGNAAIEGVVIRMRDITDLARIEANYEALVENSLQGLAVECEGRIVYANQALANLFGVRREQVARLGSPDGLRHVHDDDQDAIRNAFLSKDGEAILIRFMSQGHEGWRYAQVRLAEVSWEGRPATQIVYADVTAEQTLNEQRERENERLAEAIEERTAQLEASQRRLREQERMATVGTLAAGIAHQINNPIGAILTSADFALLTADDPSSRTIQGDALEDIRSQAIRCGKIVRSVLQFSRAEATEKWPSDLTSVLRAAVDVTQRYAHERGAVVELQLDHEAAERTIVMNPIELEQVFVNLIRNALEAQEVAARVRVSTRLFEEDTIEVSIEDDGPGIEASDASHIFDPFYTTRLRDGGTGLGLSVAHGIVVDHGGSLWLEDNVDTEEDALGGARFHVTLPTEKSGIPA